MAALLVVEFLDELAFGAWSAAWPMIRTDLELSYVQVGLLLSIPSIFGSMLEPPLGLLGDGWNRRALVRGGGVAFAAGLLFIALSDSFATMLLALLLINPASGAFVGLSQAVLMDLAPDRHEQNMARWALAGSIGMVAGPLVLAGVGVFGFHWRATYALFAVFALAMLAVVWRLSMPIAEPEPNVLRALQTSGRDALRALRRRDVLRWLTLLHFSDLMLDVLHGFLALYFVDVVGVTGARAALAILVWTGIGLIGDALVIPVLERVRGVRYVRATALLMLFVFPAFLLLPGELPKLAILGLVGMLTSGWYSVLAAQLYSALPGQSATVMSLSSAFGIVAGALPLLIGLVAQQFGLSLAMWLLLAGPVALLIGLRGAASAARQNAGG